MPARSLSAQKIRNIITLNAHSRSSYRKLSRLFDVASSTVGKYLSAFARSSISVADTRRLSDQELKRSLLPHRAKQTSDRHRALTKLFPIVHQCLNDPSTSLLEEWQSYRKQYPAGYCYSQFSNLYGQWLSTNRLQRLKKPPRRRWAMGLSTEDIKV